MLRTPVRLGLALALVNLISTEADADLLRPTPPPTSPEIVSDRDGTMSYRFDAASRSGLLHLETTPMLLTSGPALGDETPIRPAGDGARSQILDLALNADGTLKVADTNSYELFGTVVVGGQTYSGLLLKGVPTALGARVRGPLGPDREDAFDLTIRVTGGPLAAEFGADAYVRVASRGDSTFRGSFDEDFVAQGAGSTVQAERAPRPIPVSEPTTLALFLASGYGVAVGCRDGRRLRRSGRS